MMELAAERRIGNPWLTLAWLFVALAVLAAVGCQRGGDGRSPTPTGERVAGTRQSTTRPVVYAPITDVSAITTAKDRQALAGREISLSSERVQRVLGERLFTVGPAGRELYVLLEQRTVPGGAESSGLVREGKLVTVKGVLERAPSGEGPQPHALDPTETGALKDQQVYLLGQLLAAP